MIWTKLEKHDSMYGFEIDYYEVSGLEDTQTYVDVVLELRNMIPNLRYINVDQYSDHTDPKETLCFRSYEQFAFKMRQDSGYEPTRVHVSGSDETNEISAGTSAVTGVSSTEVRISTRPITDFYERYTGNADNIEDALREIGEKVPLGFIGEVANKNWLRNYKDAQLLEMLKAGKLRKP